MYQHPPATASACLDTAQQLLETIWDAAKGAKSLTSRVVFTGQGHLPSFFSVTDLAAASMGAANLAATSLAEALDTAGGRFTRNPGPLQVDRRLASFWFGTTLRPEGWKLPKLDELPAADYLAKDGWLRLHTNASHHLAAALKVLGTEANTTAMARAVSTWKRDELAECVIAQGGCAATMLSPAQWLEHAQGLSVSREPLIDWLEGEQGAARGWEHDPAQPLKGVKILDMTRVLAGPAATRMLAGLGAQVLRLDSPLWDESNAPEMALGKRCALLDLRQSEQRAHWVKLLSEADVLVHGYRSDALARMGLDAQARQRIRPGLVDVSLDAYGFTGPWAGRRGFDSLVQMSIGIAQIGQELSQDSRPFPLPVQALDHATGYLLATAVIRGLEQRIQTGQGSIARTSLARTGMLLLTTLDRSGLERPALLPETAQDLSDCVEHTAWGQGRRIKWPVSMPGIHMSWAIGAGPLKRDQARWN